MDIPLHIIPLIEQHLAKRQFPDAGGMEWGRQMALVNHFYFYLWDPG